MWNTGTMRISPRKSKKSRLYHDMRNHPHHCSGYRVIHWNPNLAQNTIHLQPSSINTIIRILAVISYFTARAVRLDEESSKLLILAPHNDTIDDLEGKLGAPAPNYPPTLFDFYLVCIYRRFYLPTNCDKFQYTNSQGNTVTPVPQRRLHRRYSSVYHRQCGSSGRPPISGFYLSHCGTRHQLPPRFCYLLHRV